MHPLNLRYVSWFELRCRTMETLAILSAQNPNKLNAYDSANRRDIAIDIRAQ